MQYIIFYKEKKIKSNNSQFIKDNKKIKIRKNIKKKI